MVDFFKRKKEKERNVKLPSPGRVWEDCLEAGIGVAGVVPM